MAIQYSFHRLKNSKVSQEFKTHKKFNLECHMKTHIPKKRFVCDECNKTFTSEDKLTKHKERKHKKKVAIPKVKKKCTKCDYETYRKSNLKRHIESKHSSLGCSGRRRCPWQRCGSRPWWRRGRQSETWTIKKRLRRHKKSILCTILACWMSEEIA